MSENPNPTRCGNCGTDNPPGQELCVRCHAPLTVVGDAALLDRAPEALDDPAQYDTGAAGEGPDAVVMGGMGGAPIPVPAKSLEPDSNRPPRD